MRQVVQIQVASNVQWQIGQTEGGKYVAVCKPLALTMQGDGLDDLAANIRDAIQLLMTDLLESGELDAFLRQHGWRATDPIADPTDVEFDVPMDLLVRTGRDSARTLLQ